MQNGGHPDRKPASEESFSLSAQACLFPLLLLFPSLVRRPRSEEEKRRRGEVGSKKKKKEEIRSRSRGVALVQILVQD